MITHRIEADKVVVDGDKIIYVPVEPQPEYKGEAWFWDSKEIYLTWHTVKGFTELLLKHSPFHPDDTLILMEEWGVFPRMQPLEQYMRKQKKWKALKSQCSKHDWEHMGNHAASSMPIELDSECQQDNVVKVLGVEEKMVKKKPDEEDLSGLGYYGLRKIWHWKLLTEVANDQTQN